MRSLDEPQIDLDGAPMIALFALHVTACRPALEEPAALEDALESLAEWALPRPGAEGERSQEAQERARRLTIRSCPRPGGS